MDRLFRDEKAKFSVGERVELTGMVVEILEVTMEGRAIEAAFRFSVPLEDPSLKWLQFVERDFVPFTPPAIGQSATLPAPEPPW